MNRKPIPICTLAAAAAGLAMAMGTLGAGASPRALLTGPDGTPWQGQGLPLVRVQDRGDPGGGTGGGTGGGGSGGEGRDIAGTPDTAPASVSRTTPSVPQPALSPPVTAAVVDSVGDAFDRCQTVDASLQIDCISQQLRETASAIAPRGAYGNVSRVLEDTARKLGDIARRDRDASRPRVSVQHRNQSGTRTYTPVRAATLAQSRAAAAKVLEQAQTLLLRSATSAENRRAHFQPIAAAMESGKVLLRSS